MNSKDYGNVVKEARNKKGLTQRQLAEKCHLGLRTVQRIESGLVSPRISTVKLINEFLDISISDYSGFKTLNIDYRTIFYLGISVFGLGVIFSVAINIILGLSFVIIGLIQVMCWCLKYLQDYFLNLHGYCQNKHQLLILRYQIQNEPECLWDRS